MYQYDQYDQTLVDQRVEQFAEQTRRYHAGELSEDEFKPLRLMNGLYIQRHAPMLRIAVPYGLLSSVQMRTLARIARDYDRGFGHFTTRQNLQFNWPRLADVPKILGELAKVQMHAIQTSGNCIRNVTCDHLAGVAADEIEDPRPYCEIIRQWSTLHPEFSFLPRKFKIAVTGAPHDRAASQVHDIGIHMVRGDDGEIGFQILAGGGLGRTPVIGKVVREFLPKEHLLSYLEAVLRVYNLMGRRDNLYKSRIKILVNALGIERFRALVEEEWHASRTDGPKLESSEIDRVRGFFEPPTYDDTAADAPEFQEQLRSNPLFSTWVRQNTTDHRQAGYRAVFISLKAPGQPPGDIDHTRMDALADLADAYSGGLIRTTHDQNLILADVPHNALYRLWRKLRPLELATPNIGTLADLICCPGLDYCSLANAGAIPVAKQIHERFDDLDFLYDLGEIKINLSGCMNACGHHHVGHIGILGVDKKGEEWYQITIGGSSRENAALGKVLGPSVPKDAVAETIAVLLQVYLDSRHEDESFLHAVQRLGTKPFKEAVYGTRH
jgi:sulfite reductase (NADPH) hemoprotein beta-component